MRFGICLAVRSTANCSPSKFAFQPIPALDRHGVDVARDDILQNYMGKDDQLMNGRDAMARTSGEIDNVYADVDWSIFSAWRRGVGLHCRDGLAFKLVNYLCSLISCLCILMYHWFTLSHWYDCCCRGLHPRLSQCEPPHCGARGGQGHLWRRCLHLSFEPRWRVLLASRGCHGHGWYWWWRRCGRADSEEIPIQ